MTNRERRKRDLKKQRAREKSQAALASQVQSNQKLLERLEARVEQLAKILEFLDRKKKAAVVAGLSAKQ
jgi:hypothetical protein